MKRLILAVSVALAVMLLQPSARAAAHTDLCVEYANRPVTLPQPLTIEGSTPYVYKRVKGGDLRLHVFNPPPSPGTSDKRPAITFFFGGGWTIGTVTEPVPQASYFASRGMVAIIADYRDFCRYRAGVTEQMADARSAIRWVRAHASELGIDPNRIAASGASSGGHLAASTTIVGDFDEPLEDRRVSSKPNALILLYPCVDETSEEERRDYSAPLGDHGRDVSPLYHIAPGLPPTIVLQGTADTLYAGAKEYCAKAGAAGNECDFVEYYGAPHGFFNPRVHEGKWYREALLEAERFLTRHDYLPGPSPAQIP